MARLSPDLVLLHVLSIVPRSQPIGGRYRVGATIAIQDTSGTPVAGAAVLLDVTRPDGSMTAALRTTNGQGRATFALRVTLTGTYTFCVEDATRYGWLYDPSLNVETSDSITIP